MSAAGWHGKLPSLGDFASRRLDPAFVQAWDDWLAAGLASLREHDAAWLDAYLASPSWRFLLMPGAFGGALDANLWIGVLMPSVDRVGRYYPFTLALPLSTLGADAAQAAALWQWLARLEDAAVDALQADWSIERLEAELAALGVPGTSSGDAPAWRGDALEDIPMEAATEVPALLARQAQALWSRTMQGHALWYSAPQDRAPRLLRSRGLETARLVATLFGGDLGPA